MSYPPPNPPGPDAVPPAMPPRPDLVVVATTTAAFALSQPEHPEIWSAWLMHAERMIESWAPTEAAPWRQVRFFAALEVDGRGILPFDPLLARFADVDAATGDGHTDHWTFSLDDGRTEVTTRNRLRHITAGQNLATDYALSVGASHLLFLAADLEPDPDAIPKMIEVDHPIVGGEVATYGLHGPAVDGYPFPVEEHMATAAFVMIRRDLLRFVRWRWDADAGMSDDPCLHFDARTFHGTETLVRKDCIGHHHPRVIGPIESRGHDRRVVREAPEVTGTGTKAVWG